MLETKLLSIVNLLHSKVFRVVLMVLPMLAFASTVSYAAPNVFATITSVICPI